MSKTNSQKQIAHRANLFLDNQLSLEAEELFKEEMQRNSETNNIVIAEQQFRRFIKANYTAKRAPKHLVASIRNNIRNQA